MRSKIALLNKAYGIDYCSGNYAGNSFYAIKKNIKSQKFSKDIIYCNTEKRKGVGKLLKGLFNEKGYKEFDEDIYIKQKVRVGYLPSNREILVYFGETTIDVKFFNVAIEFAGANYKILIKNKEKPVIIKGEMYDIIIMPVKN